MEMRSNPVSVYKWAQKFCKISTYDTEQQLKDKFFSSIDSFLQSDFTNEKIKTKVNTDDDDQDDYDDISEE